MKKQRKGEELAADGGRGAFYDIGPPKLVAGKISLAARTSFGAKDEDQALTLANLQQYAPADRSRRRGQRACVLRM